MLMSPMEGAMGEEWMIGEERRVVVADGGEEHDRTRQPIVWSMSSYLTGHIR